jgi:hypothetical protein
MINSSRLGGQDQMVTRVKGHGLGFAHSFSFFQPSGVESDVINKRFGGSLMRLYDGHVGPDLRGESC